MVKTLAFDLNEVMLLFRDKRVFELRGIGNRLIREAAMESNYGKAELGVIAYALHKIETKQHFVRSPKWGEMKRTIINALESCFISAKKEDYAVFMASLKKVVRGIDHIDSQLGNYAQTIYEKAKVKQASLAYSYGLSIAQAADLTGADKKELQSYIGFTTMHDEEPEVKDIVARVKDLFALVDAD